MEAYREIKSAAMILIIQLISQQIFVKCNRIQEPHELWNHLRAQYYSDTPYSFVHQIHSLLPVRSSFDSSKPVSEFIDKFESEWALSTQLSTFMSKIHLLIRFISLQAQVFRIITTLVAYQSSSIMPPASSSVIWSKGTPERYLTG